MPEATSVQCCIAGGGLAGITLGLLLPRVPLLAQIPARKIGLGIRACACAEECLEEGYFG
jgi:hypothetical protein